MAEVFSCRISVGDYLSFFRSYMSDDLSIEKDLGKWNQIYFLMGEYKARKMLVNESNYYKDIKISTAGSDFSATKLPSELSAMSITSL